MWAFHEGLRLLRYIKNFSIKWLFDMQENINFGSTVVGLNILVTI